jgi:hypothetical protein
MKRFIVAGGLAVLLATGSSLAILAQTTDPVTGQEGTLITAVELANAALNDIETVRVVDVDPLLEGARADTIRVMLDHSDPAAIRDYLEQDNETSEKIRQALRDADVPEDAVVAMVRLEDDRLVVFYRRGS